MRYFLPAFIALCLAGCSNAERATARYEALDAGSVAATSHQVDRADLFVQIPEWAGAMKEARQSREGNVSRQDITFAGGTRGAHEIQAAVEMWDAGNGGAPTLHRPTVGEINDELQAKFPGVAMRVMANPMSDVVGPYYLAIGKASDGTRCLYAWRWMEDLRVASDPSGIASFNAMISRKSSSATLRIRLCSKYVTLDDLASLAQQIRFVPMADITRIAAQNGRPSLELASRVDASAPTLDSQIDSPKGEADLSPQKKHSSSAAPPAKKRVAHKPKKQKIDADILLSPSSEAGGRYLAPLPGGDVEPSPVAGPAYPSATSAAPAPAAGAQGLNLPAAAFRGPSSPTAAKTTRTP